jgi:hypothetical protein
VKLTKDNEERAEREKELQNNVVDLTQQVQNANTRTEETQTKLHQLEETNKILVKEKKELRQKTLTDKDT